MSTGVPRERVLEAIHARMTVRRERAGVVVVEIDGTDVGELRDAPFCLLERILEEDGAIELFIDARRGRSVSIDVSNDWALWLRKQRPRLRGVHMLAVTRWIRFTAGEVRRFAGLDASMSITSDATRFERALGESRAH